MDAFMPLIISVIGILILLVLVLRVKLPAFLALLLVSLGLGIVLSIKPDAEGHLSADTLGVIKAMQDGMGGTLGFVAIVVGLGAMLGALIEAAGGIDAISNSLLKRLGEKRAGAALGFIGFLVAIPVFFDVAFIILVPLIHKLSRNSGKALLKYALPLLAGLAVTHAFIPPTPGPIAVAELLSADLGWVILMGAAAGLPAMFLAGPFLARFYENTPVSKREAVTLSGESSVSFAHALFAILLPLVLIVGSTVAGQTLEDGGLKLTLQTLGHPFTALLLSCLYVYIAFGRAGGIPKDKLLNIMNKALEPAGVVILITGAGGVLKSVLIYSGVGGDLAQLMQDWSVPIIVFAFLVAALMRVAQGSATVAMLTAAGLTAPLLTEASLSAPQTALIVIAIASGASLLSHVNDSGFWLVNRYLDQTEAETLRSWTVASTIVGVTGFTIALILSVLI